MSSTPTLDARIEHHAVVVEPLIDGTDDSPSFQIVVRHLIWYKGGGEEQVAVPFPSLREALAFAREICTQENEPEPAN